MKTAVIIFSALFALVSISNVSEAGRIARQLPGGVRKLSDEELVSEKQNLAQSLTKLAAGDGPNYTIDKVYSGTKQVVSGFLVKLDADLVEGNTGEKSRCLVSIWSQAWLKKDGYELTFECKDKEKVVSRHSRSAGNDEESSPITGGIRELNAEELVKEEGYLAQSLTKLASGEGPNYKIDKVYSGTIQIVAGSLVKLDADLIDSKTGEKNRCLVAIWTRGWLKKDGYELTFECKDKPKVVQRHS